MDSNQYISGGIGASVVIAVIVLKQIYNTINHRRLRSNCCGTKLEASVDIDETTPKDAVNEKVTVLQLPGIDQSTTKGER
jgi:hypothetical protein